MGNDPIGYNLNKSNEVQGFVPVANGQNTAIDKIKANTEDHKTQKVLVNNLIERNENQVFGVEGMSSVYALDEPTVGELHKSFSGEILSSIALKDAMTSAPEPYGLGDIDIN